MHIDPKLVKSNWSKLSHTTLNSNPHLSTCYLLQNSDTNKNSQTLKILFFSLSRTTATAMTEFLDLESQDAVRMPWNVLPGTKQEAAQSIIPISAIYTPLKPFPNMPVLPYSPLRCRNCRSVLNPFAIIDYSTKVSLMDLSAIYRNLIDCIWRTITLYLYSFFLGFLFRDDENLIILRKNYDPVHDALFLFKGCGTLANTASQY